MAKNRLDLNFKLETNQERSDFLNSYITQEQFLKKPPTNEELETMANYVLWGKDPETGLNSKQDKSIQLESRYKTWDFQPEESFEALLESPNFNESMIKSPDEPVLKQKRTVFSRDEARAEASPEILKQLEQLWVEIDELELTLTYYDLLHNRRQSEPRAELVERIAPERREQLKLKAASLKQFTYLKLRHYLVELRRDQFSYRDSYRTLVFPVDQKTPLTLVTRNTLDSDVPVFPAGLLYYNRSFLMRLFPKDRFPTPDDFSDSEISYLTKFYWKRQNQRKVLTESQFFFDFCDLEHVYNFLMMLENFQDESAINQVLANTSEFINTLKFYTARAELTEVQHFILNLKLKRIKNQTIADYVNQRFKKSYSANYISTIFRQKIIPQINDAARQHELIIQNLCFPENFKKCRTCGTTYLIDATNFTRKSRSKDGFSNQCKKCDKCIREEKKNETKTSQEL